MKKTGILFLLFWVWPAWEAFAADGAGDLQNDLERLRRRIEETRKEREESLEKQKSVLSRLELIDRRLERLKKEEAVNRRDLEETRKRLQELNRKKDFLAEDAEEARFFLKKRLAAIQRLGASSFWLGLASAEKSEEDISAKWILRWKFERLLARGNEKLLQRIRRSQHQVEETAALLAQEESRRRRIVASLSRQSRQLEQQKQERRRFLNQLKDEMRMSEKTLAELAQAAKLLEAQVQALLQREREVSSGGPFDGPGLGAPMKRLRRPVSGPIRRGFGRFRHPEFNAWLESSGIEIAAEEGTPVVAVQTGLVRFADWFKGYGKLVILDHGKGYYSLYGYLSEVYVETGQIVVEGRPLGAAGSTGSLTGSGLYFEIRKKGLPVDPQSYLKP